MPLQWETIRGIKEIFDFIDDVPHLVRPANFPEGTPGKGITYIKSNGKELAVINLQGRTFLPPLDDPFAKADELIEEAKKRTPYILLIFTPKRQAKNCDRLVHRRKSLCRGRHPYTRANGR